LNFCEWVVCNGLQPPQFFTFAVQHDLLSRVKTAGNTFNGGEFVVTVFVCGGHSAERDAWNWTF
jgi:hypothetical protein